MTESFYLNRLRDLAEENGKSLAIQPSSTHRLSYDIIIEPHKYVVRQFHEEALADAYLNLAASFMALRLAPQPILKPGVAGANGEIVSPAT